MKARKSIAWSLAVIATIFACHVSSRLHEASVNYVAFKNSSDPVKFSTLVLYALHLYTPASYSSCINNLRQIDGAKQQWALKHGKKTDDTVTWEDITPYLYLKNGRCPWCPHGGVYTLGTLAENPRCSVKGHVLP
jgi:hypothetical protein